MLPESEGELRAPFYLLHRIRSFLIQSFPFLFLLMLYDCLRFFPKAYAGPIHVETLWKWEDALFGLPGIFFAEHHWIVLDLLTALVYSLHLIAPCLFALWLFFRSRPLFHRFSYALFCMNLFAFLTYIFFPTAPPWYVELYGFTPPDWSIEGYAAGLLRADALLHISFFESMYRKSTWVFGALPSMHAGFPLLILLYARYVFKWRLLFLLLFLLLVWFSAIYLQHHYLIDLLASIPYAFAAKALVEYFMKPTRV